MSFLLLSIAVVSYAEQYEPSINYYYSINEDGTITIIKYVGNDHMIIVPSEIDGHTVTVIGDAAFESCESLESIIVPSSILSIGMTTSAIR